MTLSLVAALVSAVLVVASAAINVGKFVDETLLWKDEQYEKLEGLRAGFSLGAFNDAFGTPVFVRQAGQLREQTYRGRDYWVQTVSGPDDVVRLYSVLSCDEGFRPTFRVTGGGDNGRNDAHVTLQSTRADRVLDSPVTPRFNVVLATATANVRFLNIWYGGNPSNYQTFAWGHDDACSGTERLPRGITEGNLLRLPSKALFYRGPAKEAPPATRALNTFPVNTYAEFAPLAGFSRKAAGPFQIGPDRIPIRTTWPSSPELPSARRIARQIERQAPFLRPLLEWLVPSLPKDRKG